MRGRCRSGAATLTKRIGVEYAKKGIRGNVIGIGYVTGPLVNRAVSQVFFFWSGDP